jgi:hypothetical protein
MITEWLSEAASGNTGAIIVDLKRDTERLTWSKIKNKKMIPPLRNYNFLLKEVWMLKVDLDFI